MGEEWEKLSLSTIKSGRLIEQFDRALEQVIQNMIDLSTTDKAREVILKVKLEPNPDRTWLDIEGKVTSKLAPQGEVIATANLIHNKKGRTIAMTKMEQQAIPFDYKKKTDESME